MTVKAIIAFGTLFAGISLNIGLSAFWFALGLVGLTLAIISLSMIIKVVKFYAKVAQTVTKIVKALS